MLKRHSNAILFRIASFFDSHHKTLFMSSFTDPLFLRSLHTPRSIANTFHGDFVHRLNPIPIYHNNSNKSRFNGLFKGGGVKPNGFTLTSCCFDSHKKPDQKARALTQHRRLLHDLGSGPSAGTTDLADGRGAYLRTRFQGNDKIVVAVDIDEGMFPFVLIL